MPTILTIDDDPSALTTMASTLEGAGFAVKRVTSVDQARHYLDDADPNLIIIEVDTDRGAGWDLLRDIIRFQGPPTIVVSHRGREEEIVEALNIGATDFLPKPFRSNELLARVRTRLGLPLVEPPAAPPVTPPPPEPVRVTRPAEDEPVFMPRADEASLFAASSAELDLSPVDESLPLGTRLRTARQRRKLTLVQINLETKIPIWYLQAMEEEKFSLLPRGSVASEMVSAYASYLRLDSARALNDYRSQYDTRPFQQLNSLGGPPPPREIPVWLGITVAAILALIIGIVALWYFAGNEMSVLGDNLRNLIMP